MISVWDFYMHEACVCVVLVAFAILRAQHNVTVKDGLHEKKKAVSKPTFWLMVISRPQQSWAMKTGSFASLAHGHCAAMMSAGERTRRKPGEPGTHCV